MQRRRPFLAILAVVTVAVVTVAGCTSSSSGFTVRPASTPVPTSPATSGTQSPTTLPPTTLPPTTVAVTSTTASPVVDAGWRALDPAAITGQWAPPCCASNWYGVPSPALPSSGTQLADGQYVTAVTWGADPTAALQVEVRRLEHCALLPEFSCEDEGPEWPSDALGVADAPVVTQTVPLDDRVRVVVAGLAERDADFNLVMDVREGNGADLAALAAAVEQAFQQALLTPLASGMSPDTVVATLNATPSLGFGPGADGSSNSLSFTTDGAPALLFQAPFRYEDAAASRGTDALRVISAEVVGGVLTLYVFAGYFP